MLADMANSFKWAYNITPATKVKHMSLKGLKDVTSYKPVITCDLGL